MKPITPATAKKWLEAQNRGQRYNDALREGLSSNDAAHACGVTHEQILPIITAALNAESKVGKKTSAQEFLSIWIQETRMSRYYAAKSIRQVLSASDDGKGMRAAYSLAKLEAEPVYWGDLDD